MHTQNVLKLQCLSTYHKYTSSLTFFLKYCILKDYAMRLANIVLAQNFRTKILPDMVLVVKNQ